MNKKTILETYDKYFKLFSNDIKMKLFDFMLDYKKAYNKLLKNNKIDKTEIENEED